MIGQCQFQRQWSHRLAWQRNFALLIAFILIALAGGNQASAEEACNKRDAEGLTALHRAAGRGDMNEILNLLDRGSDLHALDSKMGVSVLHKAVYSGKADAVELLLKRGALVNLQSPSNGNTPLHDALYFKRGSDLSVVKTLLEHGANQHIKNRAGLAPLESSRILKDAAAEKLLLDYEARRQSPSSRALMAAVKKGNFAEVQAVMKSQKVNLDQTDEQGFSPLLWASREGFTPIVNVLLEAGADPNQKDQWMGATAGHKAAFWGRADVMKLLISHGLDLNARGDYNGYTALMDAVTRNHLDVAAQLIKAGADINVRGHDGMSAVDIAEVNHNPDMTRLLQKKPD